MSELYHHLLKSLFSLQLVLFCQPLILLQLLDLLTEPYAMLPASLYSSPIYLTLTCSRSCLIRMSWYTVLFSAECVSLHYPPHTPFSTSSSLDWGREAVMSAIHLYHCQCMCASVTKAAVNCTADYTAWTHNNTLLFC